MTKTIKVDRIPTILDIKTSFSIGIMAIKKTNRNMKTSQ
jgi:hypothetical protein